jgi:hypothetical protein
MHYLFFDESYLLASGQTTIVMAAWAVEQDRLNRHVQRLPDLYRSPVMEAIKSMLESLDAQSVIATARLDATLYRGGEIDGTDDIPAMARTDNAWSACSVFLVGSLIKERFEAGHEVGTVDVYFDPKSLKPEHAEALKGTFRQLVVSEARRYAFQRGSNLLRKLRIRRIEPVKKPNTGQTPDKFQIGTWVADKLCSHSEQIGRTSGNSRIRSYDLSDVVKKTVQQFDGKSFHED